MIPSQMARQPTAGGMRLVTAQRMGTAQRFDQNGQPLPSVGLSANLVVDNRPVTRQGLTGMQTKPLGPGRQIADDKYFINELRNKITEINAETGRMKQEMEQINKDNLAYQQYDRKYESLLGEVKDLEGELADFNLALDKLRTNTDVEDIKDACQRLKQRNAFDAKQIDEVFMNTQNIVRKMKQAEQSMAELHDRCADRMSALGEEAVQEYKDLQEDQKIMQQQIDEKGTKLMALNEKIKRLTEMLQSKDYQVHQRGLELQKKKKTLLARRLELEEDTSSTLSPEEMKEKLKQKANDTAADIESQERRIKQLDELLERYSEEIQQKEVELSEAKKHASKAKKYEAVYERDRKMQEFIDSFPNSIAQEKQNKQTYQNTIYALMKHISKQLNASGSMPDANRFSEMKDELSFKERNLANSKSTLARLQQDLEQRKEELEKINQLDKKITLELSSLKDKMESMHVEMSQFKSEEEVKREAEDAKKHLLKEKQRTRKLRENAKHQVAVLGQAFDKKKRELAGNEVMKRVDGLEQRLRTHSATVFSLQEFINSRKRESDYEGIREEVCTTQLILSLSFSVPISDPSSASDTFCQYSIPYENR